MTGESSAGSGRDQAARDQAAQAALAALPRLAQMSNAITRGRITERATEAAGHALDRPAMRVLVTLHTAGEPLRISEIANRMQVVGPHVTRQVQELERRGLVNRVSDPRDRRASLIGLTAEGTATATRYATFILTWLTDAISDWSDQDRADLGRLLGRLADAVTARLADL